MGINYSKCIKQANKLQNMAYEYRRLYDSVMKLANNSTSYWQGEANQTFREEIENWKREAVSIKNEMEELSVLIKQVSEQIRDEEMSDE